MKHFKILNTVRYQYSEFILVLAVNRLQQFNILVELLLKRINEKKKKINGSKNEMYQII